MIGAPLPEFDPIMPFPVCPHCGTTKELDLRTYGRYKGTITCHECKGRYEVHFGGEIIRQLGGTIIRNSHGPGGVLISPPKPIGDPELLQGLTAPIVPREIFNDYQEAIVCLSAGAPRGAVVLCRYTIQRALLLININESKPEHMVNIARQQGKLSEMALRQCSAAVFMGGKGAHPQIDWAENITPNDARQALLATRRVIVELFNPPAT